MLSFSGKIHMRTKHLSINMQKNKLTKSLQVPCNPLYIISKSYLPGKRVLPFTLRKRVRAGITVEAAVVLPLFVFFSLAVLTLMDWFDTQRRIQTIAESLGEKLSVYAYGESDGTEESEEWLALFSDVAAGVWLSGKIKELNKEVWIKRSEVPDPEGNICFEVLYREQVPFLGKIAGTSILRVAVKRRCWNGLDGKLRSESSDKNHSGVDESGKMVYIGETMTRYHTYRDCQYLANRFQTTTLQDVGDCRNADGNRYRPCETCDPLTYNPMNGESAQYVVYITARGRHYHCTPDCVTMIAYLRKVPLEEVAYLGECSACARRHDGN